MVKTFYSIFLFTTLTVFGQNSLSQEDKIYTAVDAFVAHPSLQGLQKLELVEQNFWKNPKPKTKNDFLALVILNCNKGYFENQLGLTSKAISSYEKARLLYQKYSLSNYDSIEYCLKPLGNLYTTIGDYDNAENTIKQYYFIANSTKNQEQTIAAVLNLSNVYQNTGKVNQAIDLLEKTIKNEKLTSVQKGNLWNNLGNNYFIEGQNSRLNLESNQKAKNAFKTSIKLLENEKSQKEVLSNAYRNLSQIYTQTQKYHLANIAFKNGKNFFFQSNNKTLRNSAKLYFEEANLLIQQQKLAESSKIIISIFKTLIPNYSAQKNSLPNSNSLYAETVLLDALDLQAEIFVKQNLPKKALEAYSLSFKIEDLFSNGLVYENSKIINQIRIRNRTEKCISIYNSLYQKEKNSHYLEKAFQLSERTKSGVLRNTLFNKKTASKDEKFLLEQFQNQNVLIQKEQQKGDLANISNINEAIKKQNELMLSLKEIRSKSEVITSENINLESLYKKLEKDKTILVEYFSGLDKIYVFTLSNQSIKLDFFSVTAAPKIISFLDYFSNADKIVNSISGYNHAGYSLYKMLKLPTNKTCQNLIIIPDGLLHFLPFEALITKENTTTNFAQMHYLLHDFRIAYNNSASFYLAFDKLKLTKNNKKSVLGIFPVFEKTNYELTFSKDEMQSIKNNFKGQFFENTSATFKNFKDNAKDFSILHLSTHANSGDTETPSSIQFYDQEVLYSELYNLNINPDLVVLSACETGIGKLYKSEGAMSVARGFQLAGAQNLLFSLWKVNDYTTSALMDYFYKNINHDKPYFEATQQAKLDFLKDKSISNAKKSPYYWSAFVYYGSIENENSSNNNYWLILGLILVLGLFFAFKTYRK